MTNRRSNKGSEVWENRTIAHGTASLEVRLAGDGKSIVLLPGLGRTTADYVPLAERLLEAGYRMVLPMPRWLGGSTGPTVGVTLRDLAGDVAAVIPRDRRPRRRRHCRPRPLGVGRSLDFGARPPNRRRGLVAW
jgi:pimeloyl-ACP methyl ester carboxylesterase